MAADPFDALELAASALADRVAPGGRRRLARTLALGLRATQAARIGAQQNPDGSAFAPRKTQPAKLQRTASGRLRRKAGRVKREAAKRAMFVKLKGAAFLRASSDATGAAVGFEGAAARIARVHQEGLDDRVYRSRPDPHVTYAVRRLLGLTLREDAALAAAVVTHLVD